jgi:hypothetical protein
LIEVCERGDGGRGGGDVGSSGRERIEFFKKWVWIKKMRKMKKKKKKKLKEFSVFCFILPILSFLVSQVPIDHLHPIHHHHP